MSTVNRKPLIDVVFQSLTSSDQTSTDTDVANIYTAYPNAKSLQDYFDAKQDKLTFDTTPTENSTNPVTSGGVYNSLLPTLSNDGVLTFR
jgi:hypothetical protein